MECRKISTRGKCIAINAIIRKRKISNQNPNFFFEELEKEKKLAEEKKDYSRDK